MPRGQADRRPFDQRLEVRILGGRGRRRTRQGANFGVRGTWHGEAAYDAVATLDADLVDERLEQCLARRHRAVGDDEADYVAVIEELLTAMARLNPLRVAAVIQTLAEPWVS